MAMNQSKHQFKSLKSIKNNYNYKNLLLETQYEIYVNCNINKFNYEGEEIKV